MRKLNRSIFGEENAVTQTQPAHLSLVVGTVIGIFAGFIRKAIPHIDIGNAGALGARAIEIVEIGGVSRGAGTANWRQTDPDDRHALTFQCGDGLVDTPRVDLCPFVAAELGIATSFFARLRRGRADLVSIVSLGGLLPASFLAGFARPFLRLRFGLLILGSCFGLFDEIFFANVLTIAEAQAS